MEPIDSNKEIIFDNTVFTHKEIFSVVNEFYTKVEKDELLSVPFQSVKDWPEHIEKLTHFWWIRLGGRPYLRLSYNPVLKHFEAGFNEVFLKRWTDLFKEVLMTHLNSQQVEVWYSLVMRMGASLSMRNEMLKQEFGQA